jgi:hypothetical protein
MLSFCFPIFIFKINVNVQDPVTKKIGQKADNYFAEDDIYGIILAHYDES